MVEECLDGADRARRDENAPHLSGDPLRRKLLEPGAQFDRGFEPLLIHLALAVISVEAEEAENAQIVFLDARFGLADEAHAAGLQIAIAADRIEHLALSIGVERIEREVAALGVLLPGGRVGDLCVPAVGLDIAAERGDLEGLAPSTMTVTVPWSMPVGTVLSPALSASAMTLSGSAVVARSISVTGSPRSVLRTAPPTARVSTPSPSSAVSTASVPGRFSHSAPASEGATERRSRSCAIISSSWPLSRWCRA